MNMASKPKPTGNKVVDKWQLECWEAEQALEELIASLNKMPESTKAQKQKKQKKGEKVIDAFAKLDAIYENLPGSDSHEVMEKNILTSIGTLTLDQAARRINQYLETDHRWDIAKYHERLDYYEWHVQSFHRVDNAPEKDYIYTEDLGKVYVMYSDEPYKDDSDKKHIRIGCRLPSNFIDVTKHDKRNLAKVFRGCCMACSDLADKIADIRQSQESDAPNSVFTNAEKVPELWKKLPDTVRADNKLLVKWWNEGYTNARIAEKDGRSQSTVENIIGILRKQYPDLVLSNKARIQYGISQNKDPIPDEN